MHWVVRGICSLFPLPLPIFDSPELTRFLCFFAFLRAPKAGTVRGIDSECPETFRNDTFPVGSGRVSLQP